MPVVQSWNSNAQVIYPLHLQTGSYSFMDSFTAHYSAFDHNMSVQWLHMQLNHKCQWITTCMCAVQAAGYACVEALHAALYSVAICKAICDSVFAIHFR